MWIRNNFREYKASSMTVCCMVNISQRGNHDLSYLLIGSLSLETMQGKEEFSQNNFQDWL